MGDTPFGVRRREGTFTATGGVDLYEQRWEVGGKPRGRVIIVHGYGEHSSRYDRFASRLNGESFSVYAYDQIGHGESPGQRAYISSFARLPKDLGAYLDWLGPQFGGAPLFLMGHSFGALVLLHYVLEVRPRDVDGLVLSSGLFMIDERTAPLRQRLLGIFSVLAPHLSVHTVDPSAISREREEVRRYAEDPLNYHGSIEARTAHEMAKAIKALGLRISGLTLPFIALHGSGDRLAMCRGSRRVYTHASSKDKSLQIYEGAYHEVLNDLDREAFTADVVDWLKARC